MGRFAIIDAGIVANIAEADEPLANNWIADDGTAKIGGNWDGDKFHPPVTSLREAQSDRVSSLYADYLTNCAADVSYMGTTFQADERSAELLNGAVTSYTLAGDVPSGFYWRDAKNINVPMTLTQLQGLGAAVTAQVWRAFKRIQERKAQVMAADSVAAVQAVVW